MLSDIGSRWMHAQHHVDDLCAAEDRLIDLGDIEPGLDRKKQIVGFSISPRRRAFGFDRVGDLVDVASRRKLDPHAVDLR